MYSLVVLTFALIQFEYSQPVHKRKKKRKKKGIRQFGSLTILSTQS